MLAIHSANADSVLDTLVRSGKRAPLFLGHVAARNRNDNLFPDR